MYAVVVIHLDCIFGVSDDGGELFDILSDYSE